jgi:hypothetical protein
MKRCRTPADKGPQRVNPLGSPRSDQSRKFSRSPSPFEAGRISALKLCNPPFSKTCLTRESLTCAPQSRYLRSAHLGISLRRRFHQSTPCGCFQVVMRSQYSWPMILNRRIPCTPLHWPKRGYLTRSVDATCSLPCSRRSGVRNVRESGAVSHYPMSQLPFPGRQGCVPGKACCGMRYLAGRDVR